MAILIGDEFGNSLSGGADADAIYGQGGDDTLSGGAGQDQLEGGAGNDLIQGDADFDTARFTSATSGVTVSLAVSGSQAVGGGLGVDTLISIEGIVGSSYNDTLTGDGGVINGFVGGDGDDLIDGGAGFDNAIYGDAASAVTVDLTKSGGPQPIGGGEGDDTLLNIEGVIGSSFNDTLIGDSNNNALEGYVGDDILDGGAGIDRAVYQSASSGVAVSLDVAGPQLVGADQGLDTLVSIEGIVGSRYNDTLIGNAGSNLFEDRGGDDLVNGGDGIDSVAYSVGVGGVVVDLAIVGPQSIGGGRGNDTLISIENVGGSFFDDALYGDTSANSLSGLDGSDLLVARAGNDILAGGAGDDTLLGGDDTDFLLSDAGDDLIDGGDGLDLALYISEGGPVSVSLANSGPQSVGGGQGVDTLINVEGLIGSNFDDSLSGDSGHNQLAGGAGNDTIDGSLGDDIIIGGPGSDVFLYGLGSKTIGDFTPGADRLDISSLGFDSFASLQPFLSQQGSSAVLTLVYGGVDHTTTFHNVALSSLGSGDFIFAGVTPRTVTGTPGSDFLPGAGGADTISGLTGMDTVVGLGGDDSLTGGAGDDLLVGGQGKNTLDGGAGSDTVSYTGAASGFVVALAPFKKLTSNKGKSQDKLIDIENVEGSNFDDYIVGNGQDNKLSGGSGDDVLVGALGADSLSGGVGGDIFLYSDASESPFDGADIIIDFNGLEGDQINLKQIDAVPSEHGNKNNQFIYIDNSDFSETAGELRWWSVGDGVYRVAADLNGDGKEDFAIMVDSVSSLSISDFIL